VTPSTETAAPPGDARSGPGAAASTRWRTVLDGSLLHAALDGDVFPALRSGPDAAAPTTSLTA